MLATTRIPLVARRLIIIVSVSDILQNNQINQFSEIDVLNRESQ